MIRRGTAAIVLTLCASCAMWLTPAFANAAIMAVVGTRDFSSIVASDQFLSGNCIFRVCNRSGFITSMPDDDSTFFAQLSGFSGVTGLYANGPASMVSIRLNVQNRPKFGQFQFDVSNGFGDGTGDMQYVWARAYNDGAPTGFDLEFDILRPTTLTFWSTGSSVFDEIRVQSWNTAAPRDLNIETEPGAVVVGGYIAGDAVPVPEPGTALLLTLGLGCLAARRPVRESAAA